MKWKWQQTFKALWIKQFIQQFITVQYIFETLTLVEAKICQPMKIQCKKCEWQQALKKVAEIGCPTCCNPFRREFNQFGKVIWKSLCVCVCIWQRERALVYVCECTVFFKFFVFPTWTYQHDFLLKLKFIVKDNSNFLFFNCQNFDLLITHFVMLMK